ncbi:MAG: hydrogenase formation protein HypD [Actinobacteria bacterium]|nr:hydrogenase formation protein HypD [Actinomycetota bacterium]
MNSHVRRIRRPVRLMEVCGTHTTVAFRSGLRALLPEGVSLVAGPGCPVCVTPAGFVDAAIEMSRIPEVVIATFGDLVRVPGSESSLEKERAVGATVKVVYAPADALAFAREHASQTVVFLGVGFETTAPGVALTLRAARDDNVSNYLVLCAHKTMPRAMEALVAGNDLQIDGFLCPGHVSVVIGASAFSFLPKKYGVPCVVAGFEEVDILRGVEMLLSQLADRRSELENAYERAVTNEGNRNAQRIMDEVFEECDTEWRGLGTIPGSGLKMRESFAAHEASQSLQVTVSAGRTSSGCRCGDVLRGLIAPPDCGHFNRTCTPARPLGPCMVSSEGACAAYARYWKEAWS